MGIEKIIKVGSGKFDDYYASVEGDEVKFYSNYRESDGISYNYLMSVPKSILKKIINDDFDPFSFVDNAINKG